MPKEKALKTYSGGTFKSLLRRYSEDRIKRDPVYEEAVRNRPKRTA